MRLNKLVKVEKWNPPPEEEKAWAEIDRCEGRIAVLKAALRAGKIHRAKHGEWRTCQGKYGDVVMLHDAAVMEAKKVMGSLDSVIRDYGGRKALDEGVVDEHRIRTIAKETFNAISSVDDFDPLDFVD